MSLALRHGTRPETQNEGRFALCLFDHLRSDKKVATTAAISTVGARGQGREDTSPGSYWASVGTGAVGESPHGGTHQMALCAMTVTVVARYFPHGFYICPLRSFRKEQLSCLPAPLCRSGCIYQHGLCPMGCHQHPHQLFVSAVSPALAGHCLGLGAVPSDRSHFPALLVSGHFLSCLSFPSPGVTHFSTGPWFPLLESGMENRGSGRHGCSWLSGCFRAV